MFITRMVSNGFNTTFNTLDERTLGSDCFNQIEKFKLTSIYGKSTNRILKGQINIITLVPMLYTSGVIATKIQIFPYI